MVMERIRLLKVKREKNILYRLKETVLFIVKNRLIGSKLFLLLYLLYTFTIVIGTVFLVILSDILLSSINNIGGDPLSIYYSLVILGFSLTAMNDLAFWIIVFSAANLLSEEIKSGLVVSYYSKPVPKIFYLSSRVLSIVFVIFFIALIPLGVMVTVPVVRHPDIFPNFGALNLLEIMLASLVATLIVFLFYIFLVSIIVTIVEERGASVLISFIIYYTSYLSSIVLSRYLGAPFYLVSLNFWVASLILVSLGVPWMGLNDVILGRLGRGILQIDLGLDPIYYLLGAFFIILGTIVLGVLSYYLYNKKALESEEL